MGASTLVLVRHGHTADNDSADTMRMCGWYDPPLSPRGKEQVARLLRRLAGDPAAALYSSPLRRAAQTAAALGEALRLRPRWLDALREIYCGEFDGRRVAEVRERHPELWARNQAGDDPDFRWPGGESYRELRARALRALRELADRHPGGRVLVVTHSGVITQVLGALAGTSAARWDLFLVPNTAVTELHWHGESASVVRFADAGHLDPSQPPADVRAAEDA